MYICRDLVFYITNPENYTISLYYDGDFIERIISKEIETEKVFSPDRTWIQKDTKFVSYITTEIYPNHDLFYKANDYYMCRYREKYVYKYNIKKEYYDDNYYTNLEGYIKDKNDYKFYYKGTPLVNTIEIIKEKIVKEPKIEYIYIEKENNNKIDSSKENDCNKETKTEIKTEYVEKEIFRIPKKVYIIIISLTVIIVLLIIKILKNMSIK